MRRANYVLAVALVVVMAGVGCNTKSPTAPAQPTPTAFGISLTASPSVAGVNESILLVAQLSGTVPDGTSVTFTTSIGHFAENGLQEETRTTTGGRATATLVTTAAGDGLVTARVPNKSDSVPVHFRASGGGQFSITSVLPNRGSPSGNEQVVINGQGFLAPLTVDFIVAGVSYAATIKSVAGDGSSITVLTPQIPGSSSADRVADVKVTLTSSGASTTGTGLFTFTASTGVPLLFSVTPSSGSAAGGDLITLTGQFFTEPLGVDFIFTTGTLPARVTSVQHGVGGGDVAIVATPKPPLGTTFPAIVDFRITNKVGSAPQSATYPKVFQYLAVITVAPVIYYINPTYGSVDGGETVMIFGRNFDSSATVLFGATQEQVVSVSADGTVITVVTRPVGGTAPTAPVDVTVTTTNGSATLAAAFTYLEGQTPEVFSLSPTQGPLEGGTRVTVSGKGFQTPVQVLFGDRQAQVVSSNFGQVVCLSPSVTQSQPNTPSTVQVTVTNLKSGKTSSGVPFRYGEAMFISTFGPGLGPDIGGTTVTIFGQGFAAPVTVAFAGVPAAQIQTVSGTQIVAVTAAVATADRKCDNSNTGPVVVTNIDSMTTATSTAQWVYEGAAPLITGLVATGTGASGNAAPQIGTAPALAGPNCAPVNSVTVTINGLSFEQFMQVTLQGGGYTYNIPAVFDSTTQVHFNLPDLQGFAFNTVTVPTTTCASGKQNVPTPMDVTITNIATKCNNILKGGLIINPCSSCVPVPPVPPVLTLSPTAATVSLAAITLPTTLGFAVAITPPQAATIDITYSSFATGPATVTTTASGIGSFNVTVPTGVTAGQFATVTIGFGSATPVSATITIAP